MRPNLVNDTESYNLTLSGKVWTLYKGVPSHCVIHVVGGKKCERLLSSKDFYFLNLPDPYSASQPITSDCEAEPLSAPMSGIKRKKPSWPSVLARPFWA